MQSNLQSVSEDSTESWPWMTVIITTYDLSRYADFRDCVDSVLNQSYAKFDIVLVTETTGHFNAVTRDYGDIDSVTIHHLSENQNLASARNAGARIASGEVVTFIDDDAIASSNWLHELARGYAETSYEAVGGSATPDWLVNQCWYLPEEFLFLVGATHKGFTESEGEVRNTFGCNISFRRTVFESLDGFDTQLGKDHGHNLQSEETELCIRLRKKTGEGVYYVPSARVNHKVYAEQTTLKWLFNRAYWQGYSKSVVAESTEHATDEDWGFLGYLFSTTIPQYIKQSVSQPVALIQLFVLLYLVFGVGLGFISGTVQSR